MKMLLIAKTGVFIMTVLILAGLTLVVLKITENTQKHKPQTEKTTLLLQQDEEINHMTGCDKYLCLTTYTNGSANRLLIINPNDGRVHQQIQLKKQ